MSDEELKQFLKRLDSSCANGPSPMLLMFNAALTGVVSQTCNPFLYTDIYPREMVRLAAQICREAMAHD